MYLTILNQSKDTLLADKAITAKSIFKRIRGLLGTKDFNNGKALIIQPCSSIHTFFMPFAIDILFLAQDNRVIRAIDSLKPFRMTPIFFKARLAIELPAGTLKATKTAQNDVISIN
ncbi:MAG: DUF192 domain-containing protein [Candidatus Omnitrophota bacterium]